MKKLLDGYIAKGKEVDNKNEGTKRKSSCGAPSTFRVYDTVCIFCNKTSKYMKGKNTKRVIVRMC